MNLVLIVPGIYNAMCAIHLSLVSFQYYSIPIILHVIFHLLVILKFEMFKIMIIQQNYTTVTAWSAIFITHCTKCSQSRLLHSCSSVLTELKLTTKHDMKGETKLMAATMSSIRQIVSSLTH